MVVPAFEQPKPAKSASYAAALDALPQSKRELEHAVREGHITIFHAYHVPGHNATNHNRCPSAPMHRRSARADPWRAV